MKHVPCIKCGRMFEMPDNYYGTILCEACDPCMNDVDLSGVTNQALIRADSAEETIKQLQAENETLKIANSQAHKDIFERQNEMAKLVLDNKVLKVLLREALEEFKSTVALFEHPKKVKRLVIEITEALEETDGD